MSDRERGVGTFRGSARHLARGRWHASVRGVLAGQPAARRRDPARLARAAICDYRFICEWSAFRLGASTARPIARTGTGTPFRIADRYGKLAPSARRLRDLRDRAGGGAVDLCRDAWPNAPAAVIA